MKHHRKRVLTATGLAVAALVVTALFVVPALATPPFVLATTAVPIAGGGPARTSGTLNLRAVLQFVSVPANCPPGMPDSVICHSRTGEGVVPGLGRVTEAYVFMADRSACLSAAYKVLAYSARLSVDGKGDLLLTLAETPECVPELAAPRASQTFTVTGGTGALVGASGSGTVTRVAGLPGARVVGEDTWTGTLVVPGLEFEVEVDQTAPTISGAKSKVVRAPRKAKRVRVTYRVTATDDVDGPIPISCRPASGSRFKIGRTNVTCSATDKTGNTATARFTVTVRRSR
jgi:HYR domain